MRDAGRFRPGLAIRGLLRRAWVRASQFKCFEVGRLVPNSIFGKGRMARDLHMDV